jgi:S1-C subfamily serine protease
MGEQAWVSTEPPLTIGRGLSATTGVIGGVLALAVLWTMLPTHAGRSAGVTVRSTVANTAAFGGGSSSSAALVATFPPTTHQVATTTTAQGTTSTSGSTAPTTTSPPTTPTTLPVEQQPLPTYAVAMSSTKAPVAVAVAVSNGSLIITTAAAVRKDNTVELRLPDGGVETASVLLVDQRSGFAVLAHDPGAMMASFTVAPPIQPGDELTFYGADNVTAVVQDDGSIQTMTTDPGAPVGELPEGTPVVNQRGELVALCSHMDGEPMLVSLEHLDSLRKALTDSGSSKVWMGVVLDAVDGSLTITALDPDGPAAAAGVLEGDVITSVDGVDVMDVSAVGAALKSHEPGDSVHVAILRTGVEMYVDITLAASRAGL